MAGSGDKAHSELYSARDTVESIWVAILIALVLRAFMVEAFVIPTGSMAPQLVGEHWDLTCPACGYGYAYGLQISAGQTRSPDRSMRYSQAGTRCPNCGVPYDSWSEYLGGGDRVLVLKHVYLFSQPQPFDVVVFRNPQNNRENYIKRLIGLPGETIEIVHGDVFVGDSPTAPRRIRRKPAVAQQQMWQVVYDNDYQPEESLLDGVRPRRWAPVGDANDWEADTYHRRWTFKGGESGLLAFDADGQVFLPHYGYNPRGIDVTFNREVDVCTDLKLSTTFTPSEPGSAVALVLTSLENRFRAEVSADGSVSLLYQALGWPADRWETWGMASLAPMNAGEGHEIELMNVDFSVKLAVDGHVVLETSDQYPETYESILARVAGPHRRLIAPPQAQLFAWGGRCQLGHIRLMRDVYYTSPVLGDQPKGPVVDFALWLNRAGLVSIAKGAPGWGTTGNPITLDEHKDKPDLDEFFVLGDNSPQSSDSRLWLAAAATLRLFEGGTPVYKLGTVPRYNMIGKAFFVYWPSAYRLPGLPGLPIVPNFGKMRLIR